MFLERYVRPSFDSYEDFAQNYHIDVPANFNFAFDCVDALAGSAPEKPALVWCNDKGQSARYSFAQMSALSDASARFFAAQGIQKGDVVMLILKRRAQFWFALLGLAKLGAVAVPATHLLTLKDIVYRNERANIKAIVTTEDEALVQAVDDAHAYSPSLRLKIKLGAARPGWLSFDAGLARYAKGEKPQRVTQNDDMMLLYFTSGTTGMPKMVAHNYTYPLAHITTARFWQQLHPGSLHLTVADTGWAKAAWGKIFGQWLCEAAVFVYDHEHFNAGELFRLVSQYKVTSFCAPPTVYRLLVKMDLSGYDLSALEHVTTAGEPLNAEVFHRFKEKTGLAIHEAYGQTEMAPMVFTSAFTPPRPGSLGKPSPAYRMLLLDEDGCEVPVGEEGEICIDAAPGGGLGVFMGYYQDRAITQKAWRFGVYHTGDKARFDADGYLWFISRADDVIKSSGYRIGPFEVESVLIEHPAVLECAVTSVPDAVRGQAVKATVVLAPGTEATDQLKMDLKNHVRQNTAAYKCPKIVEFVAELPKTISGKIQHMAIRKQALEVADGPARKKQRTPVPAFSMAGNR